MNKIKTLILSSILAQAIVDASLTTMIGIFSGTFTIEIANGSQLIWESFFKTVSFYVLVFLIIIYAIYKRFLVSSDNDISKFKDEDYCLAYARSQMLPEAAKKAVEKIRNGNGGEFHDAMKEIKKVLK